MVSTKMAVIDRRYELPFAVKIPLSSIRKNIDQWCVDHFGDEWGMTNFTTALWGAFWGGEDSDYYHFCFRHEKDAILFSLRWL